MSDRKKRILVVEDDESVRMLLIHSLSVKYEVEAIADGNAAFLRIQNPPIADLIVCDIMLPGVNGWTIARRAKRTMWAQVPIIFLTARTTPRDVIQGIQAGARHYMMKPFKLKDLLDKVNRTIGG